MVRLISVTEPGGLGQPLAARLACKSPFALWNIEQTTEILRSLQNDVPEGDGCR
jgi:hypothetical protein